MSTHISIACDHGGYGLKSAILGFMSTPPYTCLDHGAFDEQSVDYPDKARLVALDVAQGRAQWGVLICTSGVGMSIAANKHQGIRAALVFNEDTAEFSRRHNNANVICLGQKYITPYLALKYLKIFFETSFEGGRHAVRVGKLTC
jgi:ribose 5-phosphate isomerase B